MASTEVLDHSPVLLQELIVHINALWLHLFIENRLLPHIIDPNYMFPSTPLLFPVPPTCPSIWIDLSLI